MTSEPPPPPTEKTGTGKTRAGWLRRSPTDRYLGGVAGGLSESLHFDPMLARIGLAGLSMFAAYAGDGLHPLVLIPYFLAWAFIPLRGGRSLVGEIGERAALQELFGALVLFVIAILVLSDGDYAFAAGLGALALALFSDRGRQSGSSPEEAAIGNSKAAGPLVGGVAGAAPSESSGYFRGVGMGFLNQRTPRPALREPALWPLTLSLLVLVAIVSILIDRVADPGIDPAVVVNMALIAIGAVLLLSFWRGRARVTILWALLLLPFWVAFSVADVGRFAGQGTSRYAPTAADADGVLAYELGYGDLHVDLRDMEFVPGSETTLKIGLTAGGAYIQVPRDVTIGVRGKVGLGGYTVRHPTYWNGQEALLNGQIRRRYPAAGIDCERWEIPEVDLRRLAQQSGVSVGQDQDPGEAIVAAGFPQPEFVFRQAIDQWGELGSGEEGHRLVDSDFYMVQTRFGTLCVPEPAPANPALLVIEPTVGVGTLEIQRVDIP